jgi:poly(3-hydroxybutyrate) depolymerase
MNSVVARNCACFLILLVHPCLTGKQVALFESNDAKQEEPPAHEPADQPIRPQVEAKPTDELPARSDSAETETGRIIKRTYDFKEAGKEMEYALYVPKSYDGTKSLPLIVALHGLFSTPRQILSYPGFTRHADQHGYLLVAPMGYNTRGWYGSRGKGGGGGTDPENLGELSEKDVMNVLERVREQFKIDDNRIFLLGHSMGGGGALHLAIQHPDIWAAIAPIAPAVPRDAAELERAKHIPAIVVQGDQDGLVHGTRRWVEKMKELGMEHRYIEVKGGGHIFVAFQHFDEIFDFFNAHPKGKREMAKAADSAQ